VPYKKNKPWTQIALWGIILLFITGCASSPENSPAETALTPTPTESGGGGVPTPTAGNSRCEGLSGEIEMQVLVGPAEVVGLEPVAIGRIPFSVVSEGGVHTVQGGGSLSYEDVLAKEWGTYSVFFDMQAAVSGTCETDEHSGVLDLTIETIGEQMVEIQAEGYSGYFPWSGTQTFPLSFPIEEGASAEGEGWAFVLHLNQ
jgi:hypothetical protein